MIILSNAKDEQVRINIDESKVSFISNVGKIVIEYPMEKMYHAEMYNLFFGDSNMGHSVFYTFKCLKILDHIRILINEHIDNSKLPSYLLGTVHKPAPSLEEILASVEPLGGVADQLTSECLLRLQFPCV